MQDALFVLCRPDVDGRSRLWRRGATGDGRRLQSDAALSLLHSAREPLGPVEGPARSPIEACAPRENARAADTTLLRRDVVVNAALNLRSPRSALPGFAVMRRREGREEKA
jgi:hypothetical protein